MLSAALRYIAYWSLIAALLKLSYDDTLLQDTFDGAANYPVHPVVTYPSLVSQTRMPKGSERPLRDRCRILTSSVQPTTPTSWILRQVCSMRFTEILQALSTGKIRATDAWSAKSTLPKSLLHPCGGAVVDTSDYDRIREGDTMPTRIKITPSL